MQNVKKGNILRDEIDTITRNIGLMDESQLLTIGEDMKEQFNNSYYDKLANNWIANPLKGLKSMLNMSQLDQTMQTQYLQTGDNKQMEIQVNQNELYEL